MANCAQCGRELPSFSFGDTSDQCVDCRRQQALAARQQPADVLPGTVPVRKPTLAESVRAFPVTSAIVAICVTVYLLCVAVSYLTGQPSVAQWTRNW